MPCPKCKSDLTDGVSEPDCIHCDWANPTYWDRNCPTPGCRQQGFFRGGPCPRCGVYDREFFRWLGMSVWRDRCAPGKKVGVARDYWSVVGHKTIEVPGPPPPVPPRPASKPKPKPKPRAAPATAPVEATATATATHSDAVPATSTTRPSRPSPVVSPRTGPSFPRRAMPAVSDPNPSGSDWVTTDFGAGLSLPILKQPQVSNCGPSAMCIIVDRVLKRDPKPNLGFMGAWVGELRAKGTSKSDPMGVRGILHYEAEGSYFNGLHSVLSSKYKSVTWTKFADLGGTEKISERLAGCTPDTPALCHIAWDGVGGHFTVCLGMHEGYLIFADPYYLGVTMALPDAPQTPLRYSTVHNTRGVDGGTGAIGAAIFANPV